MVMGCKNIAKCNKCGGALNLSERVLQFKRAQQQPAKAKATLENKISKPKITTYQRRGKSCSYQVTNFQ